jgi:hypothetical protein
MGNNFFEYLQKLELMVFFSGYPLIYAIIFFIAGNAKTRNTFKNRIVSVLPYSYALVGTLYLGFILKNLYPDYSFHNIRLFLQQPWLVGWGLLSILFWIPSFSKMKVLSLIHSLIFFSLLIKDIFIQQSASLGNSMVKNDMNVYTISLLLNLGAVILILLLSFIYSRKNLQF